jgi:iron complex transport system permease protein
MTASRKIREATTLLIFGVMLGFILNAVISVMQYTSNAESIKIFYSWSAGSFSLTCWSDISIMASALIIGSTIAAGGYKGLDIILFGEDFSQMAGTDTHKIHFRALLSCSIMTGAVTAFCGPIGFLGIVAPHIARAIFKTSAHKTILPGSILVGCIISISADILSQLSPTPLPVSSTMALIGIPIIIYIITRKLK